MIKELSVFENSDINEIALKLEKGFNTINGIIVVLNKENKIVGCISDGDFRRFHITNSLNVHSTCAKDIMNINPIFFPKGESLKKILDKIPEKLISLNRSSSTNLKHILLTDKDDCFIDIIDISSYNEKENKIAVIGLGYVGLTLSLVLGDNGFVVSGIDNNNNTIKNLSNCISHVREPNIERLLSKSINKNLFLKTTLDSSYSTYIISVGTPIENSNGVVNLNTSYLLSVLDSISRVIQSGNLIILRSTVPIGTCRDIVIPRIEKNTGMICGLDFFVSFAPERTEEGNALKELTSLPQVIGGFDEISTKKTKSIFEKITNNIVVLENLEEAEMVKLLNNSFRDYVFAFSNQVTRIANNYNLDIINVINSANFKYPRNPIPLPSPGVGGPCLTKDPYIFENSVKGIDDLLFIKSREENKKMPKYVYDVTVSRLKSLGKNIKDSKIYCCGLAFKGNPKTGDLRNSTAIEITNLFSKQIVNTYGFDFEADRSEISALGIDFQEILDGFNNCDVVLFLNNHSDFKELNINELSKKSKNKLLIIDCWNIFQSKMFNDNIVYSNLSKIYL